jgi:hypothetical protein
VKNAPRITAGFGTASFQDKEKGIEAVDKSRIDMIIFIRGFVWILLEIVEFMFPGTPHRVHIYNHAVLV